MWRDFLDNNGILAPTVPNENDINVPTLHATPKVC